MLIIPVIIIRTIAVGNIELKNVVISKQIQAFIGAQIDGEVMPARFLILVHKAGCRSDTISQSVCNCTTCCDVFAIVIENERKYSVANPCGNILIGNIYPHAKFGSIFKLLIFAQVCQRCHHITGFEGVTVVDIERHGTVAAVDLAGCRCYGIYLAFRQYIVVCTISEVKVAHVFVFKVIYNLRAFAEFDGGSCRNSRTSNRCRNAAFGNAAIACCKVKAVDSTDTVIFKGKLNIACLDFDFVESVCGCQRQSNGFAERNRHFAAVERQFFGNNGMNRNRADLFAVVCSCQNNIADSCSCQNAVFICTVYNSVCDICRNFCRRTGGRYTCYCHFCRSTGSYIFIFRIHCNTVKCVRRNSCRCNDKTGRNRTLGAVGRSVDDLDFVGAFGTGSVSGRAAAIQIDSSHTAGLQHDLRQLVHGTTAGEGLLAAIQNHENDLTLGSNTHASAGVSFSIVSTGGTGSNIFAVTNQPLRPCGCLPDSAFAVFIDIFAEIRRIVYDCRLAIFEYSKEVIIVTRTERHAVNESDARRLTGGHVVEGRVYARNNIIVLADEVLIVRVGVLLICVCNLIGEFIHTHNTVFVLFEVGGLHHHVVAGNVRSGHIVDHLLAVLGIGIVDVLLYAGSQRGFSVLEHIVSLGHKRSPSIQQSHTIFLFRNIRLPTAFDFFRSFGIREVLVLFLKIPLFLLSRFQIFLTL